MNSLREIIEASPATRHLALANERTSDGPQALGAARWDWSTVKRILFVRLRSIGDAVLATASLFAVRRFLPNVQLHILLEDWVAPLFEGLDLVDEVITIPQGNTTARARVASEIRNRRYDVVYNLHGGTTATLLS